jgi:hypothetical protein
LGLFFLLLLLLQYQDKYQPAQHGQVNQHSLAESTLKGWMDEWMDVWLVRCQETVFCWGGFQFSNYPWWWLP